MPEGAASLALLDSNVLLRMHFADATGSSIRRSLSVAKRLGINLVVVPQVMIEFRAVATRPTAVNGFGWSSQSAAREERTILELFPCLEEGPNIFPIWRDLVTQYDTLGKNVHDARLVAHALAAGIKKIVTLNGPDFARYREIEVIDPRDWETP